MRAACLAYWSMLTLLLLVKDPLALLGFQRHPGGVPSTGIHFVLFAMLGLLAAAARWPLGRKWLAALLVGYATVVELLQWFVPQRTVQLADWIENLLGLAAGVAMWQIGRWMWRRHGCR